MLAINAKKPIDDPNRHRYGIDDFYVKTADEVWSFLAENYSEEIATKALENTVKISNMCEDPTYMEVSGHHLPIFPVKDEPDYQEFLEWKNLRKFNIKEDAAYMRFKCLKSFQEKYGDLPQEEKKEKWERVKKELKVLEGNDFSSYMLVVADFINWAKRNDILVGPSRGSGAGTLVGYLLGIHVVDPLKYGLLFERFQNAQKKDLPDIDVDFTSNGRDKVQDYVCRKYGKDNCAHISNINTYTPKM